MNFRLMADKNRGMISSPDCTGVRPGPTWQKSGKRNSIPPAPSQTRGSSRQSLGAEMYDLAVTRR